MRIRTFIATALLFGTVAGLASAQTSPSPDDMAIARHLYQNAPAKKFVDNVDNGIDGMTNNIRKKLGFRYAKDVRMIGDTLRGTYYSEILHEQAIEHLARIVAEEPEHAASVAEWLHTPETIRVREADSKNDFTSDEEFIKKFYDEMDVESDSMEDRMALLVELQSMEKLAEITVSLSWKMVESLYHGMNVMVLTPRGEKLLDHPSQLLNDSMNAVMLEAVGIKLLTNRLYLYRELTDEELVEYGLFMDTEAGRWYSDAISRALNSVYADRVRAFEERMNIKKK